MSFTRCGQSQVAILISKCCYIYPHKRKIKSKIMLINKLRLFQIFSFSKVTLNFSLADPDFFLISRDTEQFFSEWCFNVCCYSNSSQGSSRSYLNDPLITMLEKWFLFQKSDRTKKNRIFLSFWSCLILNFHAWQSSKFFMRPCGA